MFELELDRNRQVGLWTWSQRGNSDTPSLVFSAGAQLPDFLSPWMHWQIQNLTLGSALDLCQLISQNTSRSGEPNYTQYTPNCKRTPVRWESLSRCQGRINIWLTYGLWIFSSHSLGSCREVCVEVEYLICAYTAWGIWFKSNHKLKHQSGKQGIIIFFPAFFSFLHTA